jgi:hypothetical protein
MRVPEKYYDEIFEYVGQWETPSKCGLRMLSRGEQTVVIVTELYQDNPGTSVTAAGELLFRQLCERKALVPDKVVYIECNPDTNSKLSFYDEEFYEVRFPSGTDSLSQREEICSSATTNKDSLSQREAIFPRRPAYRLLPPEEVNTLLKS